MTHEPPHPERQLEDEHLRATLALVEQRRDEVGSFEVQGFTTHDTAARKVRLDSTFTPVNVAGASILGIPLYLHPQKSYPRKTTAGSSCR